MQHIIDSIMENKTNDMSIGIAFMIDACITGKGTYIDTEMNPFLPPKPVENIKILVDDMFNRLDDNEIIVFGDKMYMNGVQKINEELIILTAAAYVDNSWYPAPGVVAIEKNGNISMSTDMIIPRQQELQDTIAGIFMHNVVLLNETIPMPAEIGVKLEYKTCI